MRDKRHKCVVVSPEITQIMLKKLGRGSAHPLPNTVKLVCLDLGFFVPVLGWLLRLSISFHSDIRNAGDCSCKSYPVRHSSLRVTGKALHIDANHYCSLPRQAEPVNHSYDDSSSSTVPFFFQLKAKRFIIRYDAK